MITRADMQRTKWSLTKDLVADQTWAGMIRAINTSAAFDATHGLGDADTADTTWINVAGAGFPDQRMSTTMKWVTTSEANSCIGVVLRVQGIHDTASQDYLWARIVNGQARISRSVNGSFTTLTSGTFGLVINTSVTIDFSAVGNDLTAIFTGGGAAQSPLTLTTTDTTIPQSGFMGFRSLTCGLWASAFTAEEL